MFACAAVNDRAGCTGCCSTRDSGWRSVPYPRTRARRSSWASTSARSCLLAFVVASAFGGVAAYLIVSADGQITPLFGLWATFKGLIAMMLGGMGSIPGAILGGLLLGVVEAQSIWYLGTEYRDLSAYFLLFLFLVFRPGGLMGQLAVEREQAAMRRV